MRISSGKRWAAILLAAGIMLLSTIGPGPRPFAQADTSKAEKKTNVPSPQQGQKKVLLKNLGMTWIFCKAAVAAKLNQVRGVIAYEVDLKSDSATILYDPSKVSIEKLKQAIAETGFQVRAVEEIGR